MALPKRKNRVYAFDGVQRRSSEFLKKEGELFDITNGISKLVGTIERRKGNSTGVGSQIVDNHAIVGGIDFHPTSATKIAASLPIAVCNTSAYYYNAGSWTPKKTSLTADKDTGFEIHLGYLFGGNNTNAPWSWDGTTGAASTTNLTSAPTCPIWRQYKEEMFAAGELTNLQRVYYSSLPTSGSITWDTANDYFEVFTNDGDDVIDLQRAFGDLLVFKKHSLHYLRGLGRSFEQIYPHGTLSQRTIQQISRMVVFVGDDRKVYVYTGGSIKLISLPIQVWLDALDYSSFPNLCSARAKEHYILYLGDVDNDDEGISEDKVFWDYDVTKNTWHKGTLPFTPKIFYEVKDTASNVDEIYVGDDDGYVYEWESGNFDLVGTTEKAINFEVVTHPLYQDAPEVPKKYYRVWFKSERGRGVVVQYRLNDEGDWLDFSDGGELNETHTELQFDLSKQQEPIYCVALKFIHSGKTYRPRLKSFIIEFEEHRAY